LLPLRSYRRRVNSVQAIVISVQRCNRTESQTTEFTQPVSDQPLRDTVGVFDARMVRIYRRLGWEPTVLGTSGTGRDAISVGLWAHGAERRPNLLRRAGVSAELSTLWFDRAFGTPQKFAVSA
jgi:N-acyl-L-homoserine lactone synthetase